MSSKKKIISSMLAFTMLISVIFAATIHMFAAATSIKVEAENYTAMSGVATEACGDVGGGQNVGWIDTGDWMDYSVSIPSAGTCTVDYRVNGWNSGSQIQLKLGSNILATTGVNTGNVWSTITSTSFTVSAGTQTFRVYASGGNFNLNWLQFNITSSSSKVDTPSITPTTGTYTSPQTVSISDTTTGATIRYTTDGTTPTSTTGTIYSGTFNVSATTTVKAIAYKSGMTDSDVASSVITIGTSTNLKIEAESYTAMSGVATEACGDVGGGQNLGWIDTGDWMDYSVSIPSAGTCTVDYRVNGWNSGSQIQLKLGSNILATTGVNTGNVWSTVTSTSFTVSAGTQTFRVYVSGGNFNLNWLQFNISSSGNKVDTPSITPTTGTYTSPQTVSISDTTSGATIRYTTDGSTPTATTGTVYSAPFVVSVTTAVKAIAVKSGMTDSDIATSVITITTGAVDFGPNVKIFDPQMSSASIQSTVDSIFTQMQTNQFGTDRYAFFFKPGSYNNNINVGFYTSVYGLGQSPNDVTITGSVRCEADWWGGNATLNFWRSVENLTDIPTYSASPAAPAGTETWAVAQAAPMRRVHIKGSLSLWDPNPNNWDGSWTSGGYIADTIVDGQISSASQQQFFTRNSQMQSWTGSNWNMVFVGDTGAPAASFPTPPMTVVNQAPVMREKPFVTIDGSGNYSVFVPAVTTNTSGASWASGQTPGTSLPISQFYIAKPNVDNAATLNQALSNGKNLIFTPGIYHLSGVLNVTRADTVVLGIGMPTLLPDNGTAAMTVADVDGVKIAGILFEAGTNNSPVLLQVGPTGSSATHSANPTTLSDLFFRVGGAFAGKTDLCIQINSNNVIGDHFWVWRADHGAGVSWTDNASKNGVIVNGNNVTMYGLFCEHFNQYCTLWNGNGGRLYFYQSEIAYDVPNQASFMDGTDNGYASYKVADTVTTHEAWGLGVYSNFTAASIKLNSAIKVPNNAGVKIHNSTSVFLSNNGEITHVVNNTGDTVKAGKMIATVTDYSNNVDQPAITPITAVYANGQTVTMSSKTTGATIRYTTDGSTPTSTTGTIYTGAFTVSATTTVKAIAYKSGLPDSGIATSVITINTAFANDLALNKTAIGTSGSGSLAFDGDLNTRWSSDWTDNQSVTVDLGATHSINGAKLTWEAAYGKDYKIQVSTDGTNWSNAYVKTGGTGGVETLSFAAVNGRYVRMQGVTRGTTWGYSLYEFEVYGN